MAIPTSTTAPGAAPTNWSTFLIGKTLKVSIARRTTITGQVTNTTETQLIMGPCSIVDAAGAAGIGSAASISWSAIEEMTTWLPLTHGTNCPGEDSDTPAATIICGLCSEGQEGKRM